MRLLDDPRLEPEPEGDELNLIMDGVDSATAISHRITETGAIHHTVDPSLRLLEAFAGAYLCNRALWGDPGAAC